MKVIRVPGGVMDQLKRFASERASRAQARDSTYDLWSDPTHRGHYKDGTRLKLTSICRIRELRKLLSIEVDQRLNRGPICSGDRKKGIPLLHHIQVRIWRWRQSVEPIAGNISATSEHGGCDKSQSQVSPSSVPSKVP